MSDEISSLGIPYDEIKERLDRFKIVITETSCWLTSGYTTSTRRGHITINKITYTLHRMSAHAYLGLDINDRKQQANHNRKVCKDPECFNPEHLYVGTQQQNIQDCLEEGRQAEARRTHCDRGHEYTEENTIMRGTSRVCLTCRRHHNAINNHKRQLRNENAKYIRHQSA